MPPNALSVPIRIVISDDHAVVRRGLTAFIAMADGMEIVASAENGDAAAAAVARYRPDVLMLDLLMPGPPPERTVRLALKANASTRIVVLTSHEGHGYLEPLTTAGVTSYILKDTPPEEIIGVIRRAHAGYGTISPRLERALASARSTSPFAATDQLTARELDVLRAIASGRSNRGIAEAFCIAERTVKSHVSNILSKLHLTDRTQAAVFAWREGIVDRHSRSVAEPDPGSTRVSASVRGS